MLLRGREEATVELGGRIDRDAARRLLGDGIELEAGGDGARAELLVFRMRGLHARAIPWPKFDYAEALWRIAATWRGEPVWFGAVCDLDRSAIRAMGRALVRYPVRAASVTIDDPHEKQWTVDVAAPACLRLVVHPDATDVAAVPPRPLLVRDAGRLFRIPWEEHRGPYRRRAAVEVIDDDLSESTLGVRVDWDTTALALRNRTHMCSLARRA